MALTEQNIEAMRGWCRRRGYAFSSHARIEGHEVNSYYRLEPGFFSGETMQYVVRVKELEGVETVEEFDVLITMISAGVL
jgi:hypothetical protein